jgi:uncharacterized phage protein gp47/JayE
VAVPRIASLYYPTKEEVMDSFLRRVRINGERYGHTINVAVGSELWLRANALAGIVVHAFANNKVALQQYSPLTAEEDKALELAEQYGVLQRTGASATGTATARCTGTVIIPDGFLCTAPNGEKFSATGPISITTSGTITLTAVNAGTAGNLSASTTLTWDSASIGFLQRTLVTGGTAGGTEDDTWEEVRARLLLKLKAPQVGTNWAQLREWALESTSSVSRAFVYPAVRGPGTIDIAVIGEDNAVLSDATCAIVEDYVAGEASDHADISVTSYVAEAVDVVIALRLPDSTSATGGGWTDAVPWPTQTTRITAEAGAVLTTSLAWGADDPAVGTTVYIHDGTTLLGPHTVASIANSGGFLRVTLNGAPASPVLNGYISAACTSIADYADTLAESFLALGPGEKSTSIFVLPRGKRRPLADASDYPRAGHRLESALMAATDAATSAVLHPEMQDARLVTVRLTTTTTEQYAPSVPATAGDAPRMLTLAKYAFIAET